MPSVLVTGANRGLGLELTRQYLADGWRVFACARSPEADALRALASPGLSLHRLDVTDAAAVDALAAELAGEPLDVLLNVAGVMGGQAYAAKGAGVQRFGSIDYDDWRRVLEVNVLAVAKMAEAFVDHVAAGDQKKVIALTSVLGSIADNQRGGLYAYRSSKAALNAVMKCMAVDLARRDIIAVPIHPGWVRTDMGGASAPLSAAESAASMRNVIADLTGEDSGRFLNWDGNELPW